MLQVEYLIALLFVLQDIKLADINRCEVVNGSSDKSGHVFEIACGDTVYYIGEDPSVLAASSSSRSVVRTVPSGSSMEQALSWESAIRQARLPLALSLSNGPTSDEKTVAPPSRDECNNATGITGEWIFFYI